MESEWAEDPKAGNVIGSLKRAGDLKFFAEGLELREVNGGFGVNVTCT